MWTLLDGLSQEGVKIDLFHIPNGYNPTRINSIYQKLKAVSTNYDLVHAQYGSVTGLLTSLLNKPKVLSLRGSDWHRYQGRNLKESAHSVIATSATKFGVGRYNEIIVMSHRMKQELAQVFQREIHVIPDPIDFELFCKMDRFECREKLFGDKGCREPWILFNTLLRTNPVKQPALAEEVVLKVKTAFPGLKMKVATNIKYNEMPIFINACNAVLCTSTHEGWPNSVKEALACDIPFVSTDVSDLSTIANRTENCFVCNDDPDELAESLIQTLRVEENRSGTNLADEIRQMSIQETARQILSVYRRVLTAS